MAKPDKGFLNPGLSAPRDGDYVVVELRHDSKVGYAPSGFVGGPQESAATEVNEVMNAFNCRNLTSHFGMRQSEIRQRVISAPPSLDQAVSADFAHGGFAQIIPRRKRDAKDLANRLNAASAVWKAFVAPRPVPAAAPDGASTESRSFEPAQGYLGETPNGVGAMAAWEDHNAKGRGVTICDIEGNWNFTHEDLPKIRMLGGELIDDLGWRDHGTAVLGEMVAKPGRTGVVGISHRSRAAVHGAKVDGQFNTAAAIFGASKRLKAGDVILIELQAIGPNEKYVAMQYWDDVYSAIRAAVAKGICVVEAAGNGNENFDLPIFDGTGLQKDSGAIVVGAGVPPTNRFGHDGDSAGFPKYSWIGIPRSRIWFSNYGGILNVQGWGWHVATTGYGDAQGGPSEDNWQTLRFSGTSSASPIVTGCVAVIQGHAKTLTGSPLAPTEVRRLLMTHGAPQEDDPSNAPLAQKIGPLPDLAAILAEMNETL